MNSVIVGAPGFQSEIRAPHFGQHICAVSVESVGFIIEGGDVGASQYGADSWTLHILALPLPRGTGAVKQSGHFTRTKHL